MEHREKRPKTGASGGSAAADHRAGRWNGHSPGYSAGLSDGVECQIGGDGFPERADSRGIVRLRRRAGDDRPGRAFADDIGRFGRDARRG